MVISMPIPNPGRASGVKLYIKAIYLKMQRMEDESPWQPLKEGARKRRRLPPKERI